MSLNEIKVHVVDYGRPSLYMRYKDPLSGKQSTKSTGTNNRKEASKIAAKWEAELQEGRYKSPAKISWVEFKHRYEDEVVPSLAKRTGEKIGCVFKLVGDLVNPEKLRDMTTERFSQLQKLMRERGLSEQTIKGNLAHLKAAFNWAKEVGLLWEVPTIRMPQRAKDSKIMKGRPITLEEFERMLSKVPLISGEGNEKGWLFFLRGLWASGLRLAEAVELAWDIPNKPSLDFSGKFPMMFFPAAYQKNNKDQLLPIPPEFADLLQAIPKEDRTGYVFNLHTKSSPNVRIQKSRVGVLISKLGAKANIKVSTEVRKSKLGKPKKGAKPDAATTAKLEDREVVKYASAHDLRRSFGERWSQKVMPAVLQQMMRHESIDTTMKFYVGRNAQVTAEAIYATVGNTFGNTPAFSPACTPSRGA